MGELLQDGVEEFARRLAGEGERDDAFRRDTKGHEPDEAIGQGIGLSRSRRREDHFVFDEGSGGHG